MRKKELLDYLNTSDKCKGKGAATLLAEILDISEPAVSRFGEIIPVKRAIKLDKIFRDSEKLKRYGLKAKGRPKFDTELY